MGSARRGHHLGRSDPGRSATILITPAPDLPPGKLRGTCRSFDGTPGSGSSPVPASFGEESGRKRARAARPRAVTSRALDLGLRAERCPDRAAVVARRGPPAPPSSASPDRPGDAPAHPAAGLGAARSRPSRAAEATDFARPPSPGAKLPTFFDRRILRTSRMRNCVSIAGARVIIGSALAVGMLLFPGPSSGQIFGPLPPSSSRRTSCR